MNELHAGATLQMPDEASLGAISPAEAKAEVNSQYHAWSGSRAASGGRLHLVPPSEPTAGAATGASAAETAALQQRVNQLQGQLSESQRMLELKNAELARLQKQLGQAKPAGAQPPKAVAPPPPAKVAQEPAKPAQQEIPPPPVAKAPRHGPTQQPKVAQPPAGSASGGSLLDWLISNWYLPLGILAALLAAAFGWRQLQTKREHQFGRTLDRLASLPSDGVAGAGARSAETQPIKTLQSKPDTSFVVEESGTHPAPRMGAAESAAMQASAVAVDDEVSSTGTAVAIDQGDPLAEADFHMAYGLYDQAADLVRIAISREPQRRDLQLKLLEVYFVWGNKDQFLQLARELSSDRDHASAGEWEKIVIMGRQIAPEDALFATGGALPGAASGGVDLNLEGGQNRVDFDLLGEPSVVAETPSDAVDLDLGAALSAQDSDRRSPLAGRHRCRLRARRSGARRRCHRLDARDAAVAHRYAGFWRPEPGFPDRREPGGARRREPDDPPETRGEQPQPVAGRRTDRGSRDGRPGARPVGGRYRQPRTAGCRCSAPTMLAGLDEDTRELYAQVQQAESRDTAIMPAPGSASGTWLFTDKDMEGPLADAAGETGARCAHAAGAGTPALGGRRHHLAARGHQGAGQRRRRPGPRQPRIHRRARRRARPRCGHGGRRPGRRPSRPPSGSPVRLRSTNQSRPP